MSEPRPGRTGRDRRRRAADTGAWPRPRMVWRTYRSMPRLAGGAPGGPVAAYMIGQWPGVAGTLCSPLSSYDHLLARVIWTSWTGSLIGYIRRRRALDARLEGAVHGSEHPLGRLCRPDQLRTHQLLGGSGAVEHVVASHAPDGVAGLLQLGDGQGRQVAAPDGVSRVLTDVGQPEMVVTLQGGDEVLEGHQIHPLGWLVERSISPRPHRGQTMYRFPYCLDFSLSMRLCRICPFHPHSREMQYTNCRTAGWVAGRRIVETMMVSLMPCLLAGVGGDNRCHHRRPSARRACKSQIYVRLHLLGYPAHLRRGPQGSQGPLSFF